MYLEAASAHPPSCWLADSLPNLLNEHFSRIFSIACSDEQSCRARF
jgi:hypothetical protein